MKSIQKKLGLGFAMVTLVLSACATSGQKLADTSNGNRSLAQSQDPKGSTNGNQGTDPRGELIWSKDGHTSYTHAANEIVQNDYCAPIAVQTVFTVMSDQALKANPDWDPSDIDTFNVTAIKVVKQGSLYQVSASINTSDDSKTYTVKVQCSGKVTGHSK